MDLTDLPVDWKLFVRSERDPVFDALMVLGPAILLVIVLLGRSPLSTALAALYVLTFPVYVGYEAVVRHLR